MATRSRVRAVVLSAAVLGAGAGCVRAPAVLDVRQLVATRGPVEARRALELRVLAHPRDVQARLALATLADEAGRPAQAIDELRAVQRLGGPLGTRWHAADRARLARLVAQRGRVRLARGAPTALADLQEARALGAAVAAAELRDARAAQALVRLRHVDAPERARGRATLAALRDVPGADLRWRGAHAASSAAERGQHGAWLWAEGARRAALEALSGARESAPALYLEALAWWTPADAPPPPRADLRGPARCRFPVAACTAAGALADGGVDGAAVRALVMAATPRTRAPREIEAWIAITLGQALRGEVPWGPALAARIDLTELTADLDRTALSPVARAALVHLGLAPGPAPDVAAQPAGAPAEVQLVTAAVRALAAAPAAEVRAALGDVATTPAGQALLRVVEAAALPVPVAPAAEAIAARLVALRLPLLPVAALVDAYRRDPAIAERLAADVVASAPDPAVAHAALGALFDALGDPARARAAWTRAAAASPEPALLTGLALAVAHAGDPDAALVHGVAAAAASGDPAVVWVLVAGALEDVGAHVQALEAARSALDLAGPDTLGAALDAAIAPSRALGRTAQADALAARRAAVAPLLAPGAPADPTDASGALAAHRARPTASTLARLWVASRWSPRDVATRAALLAAIGRADPRRATLIAELTALAGDPEPATARAAVRALVAPAPP